MPRIFIVMLAAIPLAAIAASPAWEPVGTLRKVAETAVLQARPGATVHAHIDANVHLAACATTPQATVQGTGHTPSVRVSCAGPKPWSLYVPVQVTQRMAVVVLTRPVAAGQSITADMLRLQPRNIASLTGGYVTSKAAVVGSVAARALAAGSVLFVRDVHTAAVIHRGQNVTLVYQAQALTVSATGLALGDAAPGQTVRVENTGSHRIVAGVVDAKGRVVVSTS